MSEEQELQEVLKGLAELHDKMDLEIIALLPVLKNFGWGRLMTLASYEWRRSLEDKGYPGLGAFVPALLTDLTQDGQEHYLAGYKHHLKLVEQASK